MELNVRGGYGDAIAKLSRVQREIKPRGAEWARNQAIAMDHRVRSHLDEQGRGGAPPPLSAMTKQIYDVDGEPDGSGIVNHLTLEFRHRPDGAIAILGIPEGKPTLVAKVQDRGCVVPVTDRMRGFMAARYGIYLRQDTTHINIPGRHFWEDSLRVTCRKARKELKQLLKVLMR